MPAPISLKRDRPTRTPKRAFLVICTDPLEAAYAEWLKIALEHAQASVLVRRDLADDQSALIRAARRCAREAAAKGSPFDEIWFFGTSSSGSSPLPRGLHEAVLRFGIQEWLLAHFEPTPGLTSADEIRARLSAHLPDLETDPRNSMAALAGRTETARRNVDSPSEGYGRAQQSYSDIVDAMQDSLIQFKRVKTQKPF